MFIEFMELLQREDKDELFRRCINRCDQAFTEIYEYEQAKKARSGALMNGIMNSTLSYCTKDIVTLWKS
jgi:hypothetical protein